MKTTQHIVLASQEQHHATAAAARTKTPPPRPVKPGRRSSNTSTRTSHHPQKQQQHALPFDRLSLQNTAPLMMPIEGCEKLFPQPRGRRNLCFVTEPEDEEEHGKLKLEEDIKRLTRVSLFESPSQSTSPPHPRKQQQTTTSRNELQDETESTESTTESAYYYEDSDHDGNSTNDNDKDNAAALESLSLDGGLGRLVPGNLSRSSPINIAALFASSETSLLSDDFFAGFHDGFRMNSDQSLGVQSAASSGSTVSVDDGTRSPRRGMGLSSEKCAGRRHLLTRWRNDEEEEKIDPVGGAAAAWD